MDSKVYLQNQPFKTHNASSHGNEVTLGRQALRAVHRSPSNPECCQPAHSIRCSFTPNTFVQPGFCKRGRDGTLCSSFGCQGHSSPLFPTWLGQQLRVRLCQGRGWRAGQIILADNPTSTRNLIPCLRTSFLSFCS